MSDLFNQIDNGAEFSVDGKHRYSLWRIWDKNKPLVMFIVLKPSTANKINDDPTIRRIKQFTFNWNYGGFYMMNLFTYITPFPEKLKKHNDLPENNIRLLKRTAFECDRVIFAWGSFNEAKERAKEVMRIFDGYALMINKDGSPRHPLYIKGNTNPIPMYI